MLEYAQLMPQTEKKLNTNHPHEKTWDHHGSYQWTYFGEHVKQRISYFLSERLHGRNLDLGGGWYLHYPNSTVVDLSSTCLDYNPAQDKLQFDLDELGEGMTLPFSDHSFDSATLVSTWQYLSKPGGVIDELQRVIRPGGEVYIINGQGAGLDECVVGSRNSQEVQKYLSKVGLDTLVEYIPVSDEPVSEHRGGEFMSVCTAMPEPDLIDGMRSRVKNKEQRQQADQEVRQKPSLSNKAFKDYELARMAEPLVKLAEYPITQYSLDYLAKIEAFSQRCTALVGETPIIFAEYVTPFELAFLLPEADTFFPTITFFEGRNRDTHSKLDQAGELGKESELRFGYHLNYFSEITPESLLDYCRQFVPKKRGDFGDTGNEDQTYRFVKFVSALGLNDYTKSLQQAMYQALKPNIPDIDQRLTKQKHGAFFTLTLEHKQRRKIVDLIEAKNRILTDGIPIVGTGHLNLAEIIPTLRQFIT